MHFCKDEKENALTATVVNGDAGAKEGSSPKGSNKKDNASKDKSKFGSPAENLYKYELQILDDEDDDEENKVRGT